MEREKIIEQLNGIRTLHFRLERKMRRYDSLLDQAAGTANDTSKERVQTTLTNKHELVMAKLADLSTEIEEGLADLNRRKRRALRFFESAELTSEEMESLYYRYIACLEWKEISAIMYWSESYVKRRHYRGIDKLTRTDPRGTVENL